MTARTFGRKGQGDGVEMPQRREAFGTAQRAHQLIAAPAEDDEIARRREAFIAAERARQANAPAQDALQPASRFGLSAVPAGPPKSVGVAYLYWFVFGAISAHRHYLGYHTSGFIQGGMWVMGWVMILSGSLLYALPLLMVLGLWMLADAFIIPSLCRDANARRSRQNVNQVFA